MGKSQTRYPHQLAVKVSPEMFRQIMAEVTRSGLKKADYLRTALFNQLRGETQ